MRELFAHDAVLAIEPDADIQAPGAAVTKALCGSWEHEPPCPLASHHSHPQRSNGAVDLRILFATEPNKESAVRQLIDAALSAGRLDDRDGPTARWGLLASERGEIRPEEMDHGQRLLHG